MPSYRLEMYREPVAPSKALEGLGTLGFEASDNASAITIIRKMFPRRLADCDYAAVWNADHVLIWNKLS